MNVSRGQNGYGITAEWSRTITAGNKTSSSFNYSTADGHTYTGEGFLLGGGALVVNVPVVIHGDGSIYGAVRYRVTAGRAAQWYVSQATKSGTDEINHTMQARGYHVYGAQKVGDTGDGWDEEFSSYGGTVGDEVEISGVVEWLTAYNGTVEDSVPFSFTMAMQATILENGTATAETITPGDVPTIHLYDGGNVPASGREGLSGDGIDYNFDCTNNDSIGRQFVLVIQEPDGSKRTVTQTTVAPGQTLPVSGSEDCEEGTLMYLFLDGYVSTGPAINGQSTGPGRTSIGGQVIWGEGEDAQYRIGVMNDTGAPIDLEIRDGDTGRTIDIISVDPEFGTYEREYTVKATDPAPVTFTSDQGVTVTGNESPQQDEVNTPTVVVPDTADVEQTTVTSVGSGGGTTTTTVTRVDNGTTTTTGTVSSGGEFTGGDGTTGLPPDIAAIVGQAVTDAMESVSTSQDNSGDAAADTINRIDGEIGAASMESMDGPGQAESDGEAVADGIGEKLTDIQDDLDSLSDETIGKDGFFGIEVPEAAYGTGQAESIPLTIEIMGVQVERNIDLTNPMYGMFRGALLVAVSIANFSFLVRFVKI